jgi:hypothetical protein
VCDLYFGKSKQKFIEINEPVSRFQKLYKGTCKLQIPVAVRSKAVCGRLVAGIAGSNPCRGMDVCLLCLYIVLSCVGRGPCYRLITRLEESYHVSSMCDHSNPERGLMF